MQVTDASSAIAEIVRLDEALADLEIGFDEYIERLASLEARFSGTRIKFDSNTRASSAAVTELERLYSRPLIDKQSDLTRTEVIKQLLQRLDIDALENQHDSQYELFKSFELDQLLAEKKIDIEQYAKRRRGVLRDQRWWRHKQHSNLRLG